MSFTIGSRVFRGSIDAIEICFALGGGNLLDGVAIAGAQFGIAADAAAFFRGAESVLGALLDQRPFQLRDGDEHLQCKATLRCRGVDRIGERFEMRALGVEFSDDRKEVRKRSRQSVEPGHHQHVAAAYARKGLSSSGRDALAPEMCSLKISVQPAAFNASTWASVACSSVETRA